MVQEKQKGRKIDPAILATVITIGAALIAGAVIFWQRTESSLAADQVREPWIERWLESRRHETDDNRRRIERLETKQMGME